MPLSPESNETVERRRLKSILKKLHKGAGAGDGNTDGNVDRVEDVALDEAKAKVLLTEPTLEGYVARHSKLLKSVTFHSTLSSPPASAKEEGQGGGGGRGNLTNLAQNANNNNKLAIVHGNGKANANGNGNGANGNSNGSGNGKDNTPTGTVLETAAHTLRSTDTSVWSPTLALVTPTNSPQESFAFEPQLGGVIAGVGSAATSTALASTSYMVECSAMSASNKILSQNTEFHAQSTTSTDLNLNLQLRQNTTNSLSEGQLPKLEGKCHINKTIYKYIYIFE